MTEPQGKTRCTSCGQFKAAADFYSGVRECKSCKRDRSRRNRADQARKIAAFERFVDILVVLADKTLEAPQDRKSAPAEAAA